MTRKPAIPDERPAGERMYLPARSGPLNFAIRADSALAVVRLDHLAAAHGAPAHVLGVANTKYGIAAVLCLARWLNVGVAASPDGPALLLRNGSEIVALVVEEIAEACAASEEDFIAAPSGGRLRPGVAGRLRLAGRILPIFDLASLLAAPAAAEPFSLDAFPGEDP